ncbi:hypothetical protein [Pseudomonas sp. PS01297]|uniref:hypothetical protein n=1 Tax=Pseudomonas sp. PS01297 TaxID=2991433 RepID=UPI00249C7912|nr:hypothetical protein [Pseudomonas sp. PS01297]
MDRLLDSAPTAQTNQIVGVATFEVVFDSAPGTAVKKIYANGRMRARLIVCVSCLDSEGREVRPAPEILESLKLIEYFGGADLGSHWSVSEKPNKYRHDMSGAGGRSRRHIGEFDDKVVRIERWVSCEQPDEKRIAAAITLPNGRLVKSNNPSAPFGGSDSSVTLNAIAPVQYGLENFRLTKVDEFSGTDRSICKWYLGLYLGGEKVPLAGWFSPGFDSESEVEIYCNSWRQGTWEYPQYIVCAIADDHHGMINMWLPKDSADHSGRVKENYLISVNDRPGEISLVQGFSGWADRSVSANTQPFAITVLDDFGTAHNFQIVTNSNSFELELK